MRRRELLFNAAALGALGATGRAKAKEDRPGKRPAAPVSPLKPPAQGGIPVAFLLSDGAVVIDKSPERFVASQ